HPAAHRVEHRHGEPGEGRDAVAEALLEVELAVHRLEGDLGDAIARAGLVREELDHLVLDERGVDVEHDEESGHVRGGAFRFDPRRPPGERGGYSCVTCTPLPTTVMPVPVTVKPRRRSASWSTPTVAPASTTTSLSRIARCTVARSSMR